MDIFRVKVFNKYGYLLDDKYTIEELKNMDTNIKSESDNETETEESIYAI
jgi:hypothetical protein